MCLIVFSAGQHPEFPLVVAANRDEFFHRPTAAMDWWRSDIAGDDILAGRDLLSGGTWLAVSASGMVTAVTNVREPSQAAAPRSRGELPLMAQALPADELDAKLSEEHEDYAGFNLVSMEPTGGWYFSNRDTHSGRYIQRGIYGLSNHLLQTPWPKLLRLRKSLSDTLERAAESAAESAAEQQTERLHDALINQLQDTTPAPDDQLPDTGVGIEKERFLSSPFIKSQEYGTRATTIVTVDHSGEIQVSEQGYGPNGIKSEYRHFRWQRTP